MTTFGISVTAVGTAGFATVLWAWRQAELRCAELSTLLQVTREQQSECEVALHKRQELDRRKDEFISTVSHELRTPLTSIRGSLGLLASGAAGEVDAKAQNLLRIASTNTNRLARLINDILDLQRMDSGEAPLPLASCSLPELVDHAVDTMRSMADTAGVRMVMFSEDDGETLSTFQGHADRMEQVLCNLLSNAIKFSPPGSTVQVKCTTSPKHLFLRVEDRGRGVPGNMLESIFGRFTQVEAADARQKGGTGLGLAICRAIVAQHGGNVWAERNDQDGSATPGLTVCVRVPRLLEPESTLRTVSGSVTASTAGERYAGSARQTAGFGLTM